MGSYLSINKTSIKACSSVTPASTAILIISARAGLCRKACFKQLAPSIPFRRVLIKKEKKSLMSKEKNG